jgi:hypothetical protein
LTASTTLPTPVTMGVPETHPTTPKALIPRVQSHVIPAALGDPIPHTSSSIKENCCINCGLSNSHRILWLVDSHNVPANSTGFFGSTTKSLDERLTSDAVVRVPTFLAEERHDGHYPRAYNLPPPLQLCLAVIDCIFNPDVVPDCSKPRSLDRNPRRSTHG